MTPREADKIIKAGKPVTVHHSYFNETFTAIFTKRDRSSIYADSTINLTHNPDNNEWYTHESECVFDRGQLEIIS